MSRSFRPVSPDALVEELAARLAAAQSPGIALRVAIDGPSCAHPGELAASLVAPLLSRGRDAVVVAAETFWRDASVRLEYGREDVDSFMTWLDVDALRREVLEPLGAGGSGTYLPSLRDPRTNRATRAIARTATPATIVIVHGQLLLGRGLPFDTTVHLAMTPAAQARRTPAGTAWQLPALERYDRDAGPADVADVVICFDDPQHPALAS